MSALNSQASAASQTARANANTPAQTAQVIPLRPPKRWHDPLQLMQDQAPPKIRRVVLWAVAILCLIMFAWAMFGKLDIIASADGKLVAHTLLKVVQPAEAGVVRELLVSEGAQVKAGQVLVRLDTTLARADRTSLSTALASHQMQVRRIEAALADRPMQFKAGDDAVLFAQIQAQDLAQRRALRDAQEQEQALLSKADNELKSARQILAKLEQSLPSYNKAAESYTRLEKEGFLGSLAAAEKQREAQEKAKDLEAQRASVAALQATIAAQQKKISQLQSNFRAQLETELADIRSRIRQIEPDLHKTTYKEGLLELRAPQDGIVKDLATTTIGAVVQPGTVVLTLVPSGEALYADVAIKNEDVGFVQVGQTAQIKLATYPFQRYGMLHGKVVHLSADASETPATPAAGQDPAKTAGIATFKARIALDAQHLQSPHGKKLLLSPGMQVVAEINQGRRTVMEYLLSPVQKTVNEAARER